MDIQDYLVWGIIGPDQVPISDVDWRTPFQVFIETRNANFKAVNSFFESSVVMSSMDRRHNIIDRYSEIKKYQSNLEDSSIIFWSSLISLNGNYSKFNEGDFIEELAGYLIYYKTYTLEIYNKYISDLQNYMMSLKNLIKVVSNIDNFENYTKPSQKIYDFSSLTNDFSDQINNYQQFINFNDWDSTFRIVTEGDIEVGSYVYYLNTTGYKSLLKGGWLNSFITITDSSNNTLTISESGTVASIDSGFTFDSVSNYVAPVI
jgi:hypothetical protein